MPITADLDDLTRPPPGSRLHDADATPDDDEAAGLWAAPNRPFVWIFHPEAPGTWAAETITEGPEEDRGTWWLCHPSVLERRPGLEGHRAEDPQDPGAATEIPRMRVRREGGIWLESRGPWRYVAETPCRHPITRRHGTYYHEVFATPVPKRRRERPQWTHNRQAYLRFLLALHREGVVRPPSDEVLDLRKATIVERLRRAQGEGQKFGPVVAAELVRRHETALDAATKASVAVREEPPPPARKARRAPAEG